MHHFLSHAQESINISITCIPSLEEVKDSGMDSDLWGKVRLSYLLVASKRETHLSCCADEATGLTGIIDFLLHEFQDLD